MILFGGSCEQCDFNSSCSHQKLLWGGKEFNLVPACCRCTNGTTFYHKGYENIPAEPMDWYLWYLIDKKEVIYGREQFILEEDDESSMVSSSVIVNHSCSRVSVSVAHKEEVKPLPLKGPRLASVYTESDNTQGSLF